MTIRGRFLSLLIASVAWIGLGLAPLPAAAPLPAGAPVPAAAAPLPAAEGLGNFQICNSADGFTGIVVKDIDNSDWDEEGAYGLGHCTGWMYPAGVRVDTDPYGPSHSFKAKRVNVANGYTPGYGPCHTNSDDHSYDPANPPLNENWRIYIKNYNRGNCTN